MAGAGVERKSWMTCHARCDTRKQASQTRAVAAAQKELTCLRFRHGEHTKECQRHGKPLAAVLHRSVLTARRHGKPALLMRFAEREHSGAQPRCVTASDQHAPHRRRESRLGALSCTVWLGTQQYYARPMRWRVRLSFSLPRVALGTCTAKRTQKKLCASARKRQTPFALSGIFKRSNK